VVVVTGERLGPQRAKGTGTRLSPLVDQLQVGQRLG